MKRRKDAIFPPPHLISGASRLGNHIITIAEGRKFFEGESIDHFSFLSVILLLLLYLRPSVHRPSIYTYIHTAEHKCVAAGVQSGYGAGDERPKLGGGGGGWGHHCPSRVEEERLQGNGLLLTSYENYLG